jgi:hypothetical protein
LIAKEIADTPIPLAMLMVTGRLMVSPTQEEAELDVYWPMVVMMFLLLCPKELMKFKLVSQNPKTANFSQLKR